MKKKYTINYNDQFSVYEEESVEEEDGKDELDQLGGILQVQTDGTFEEPTRLGKFRLQPSMHNVTSLEIKIFRFGILKRYLIRLEFKLIFY